MDCISMSTGLSHDHTLQDVRQLHMDKWIFEHFKEYKCVIVYSININIIIFWGKDYIGTWNINVWL